MIYRKETLTLAITGIWLGMFAWRLSWSYTQPTDLAILIKVFVSEIRDVMLWLLAWAAFTYAKNGEFRFAAHALVAVGICLFDQLLLSFALPLLFFAIGWAWNEDMSKFIWAVTLCIGALAHLHIAVGMNHSGTRRIWGAASAISLILYGATLWAEANDQESRQKLPYGANIYPAILATKPAMSIEDGVDRILGSGK